MAKKKVRVVKPTPRFKDEIYVRLQKDEDDVIPITYNSLDEMEYVPEAELDFVGVYTLQEVVQVKKQPGKVFMVKP